MNSPPSLFFPSRGGDKPLHASRFITISEICVRTESLSRGRETLVSVVVRPPVWAYASCKRKLVIFCCSCSVLTCGMQMQIDRQEWQQPSLLLAHLHPVACVAESETHFLSVAESSFCDWKVNQCIRLIDMKGSGYLCMPKL